MTKRKRAVLLLVVLIACLCAAVFLFRPASKPYSASVALACDALGFEYSGDGAYVTLRAGTAPDAREIRVHVMDADLQKQLDTLDLTQVIGAQLLLTLPAGVLKDRHLSASRINPLYLLSDASFDSYWTLLELHLDI